MHKGVVKIAEKKDSQSNKYLLTVNNPKEKNLTHDKIKRILLNNFKTLEYFAMADEMGKTYHTHLFLYFRSRVRFSMVKKNFPEAHIDVAKGMVSENINYIKKLANGRIQKKQKRVFQIHLRSVGKDHQTAKENFLI